MSGIYVFLGPTLPVAEARQRLDATYLPPVEQGDVIRLLRRNPKAIGIIDGRFQFLPSVWHKEILAALSQGVHVFGAASMGALRAAELSQFGMVGIGRVFEAYRSGEIDDDDEVAISHADASLDYRETSDAMVNIRDAAAAAVQAGVLTESAAQVFIDIAKSLYFPERSWARVFEIARDQGVDVRTIAAIDGFRREHVPVKRRDALELLDCLAEFERESPAPFRPQFVLEQTIFLENLQAEAEIDEYFDGDSQKRSQTLEVARKKVLLEILCIQEARRQGLTVTEADTAEITQWFRTTYGLEHPTGFAGWMANEGLTDPAFREVMQRFAAVNKIERLHRAAIDRALPDHVRVTSARDRRPAAWLQINVELTRANGSSRANAQVLFSRLNTIVDAARQQGNLDNFFFVRKPPDIRLRFLGNTARLLPKLEELLEESQRAGIIVRHFQSTYEPETALFGGAEAMELVHDFFDADTQVWLRMENYSRVYSLELLNQLFLATLGCANETWQTWDLLAESTQPDAKSADLMLQHVTLEPPHASAIQAFSAGLKQLWEQGQLRSGPRSILASLAMFHFNRYGVPGGEQAQLARLMVPSIS